MEIPLGLEQKWITAYMELHDCEESEAKKAYDAAIDRHDEQQDLNEQRAFAKKKPHFYD